MAERAGVRVTTNDVNVAVRTRLSSYRLREPVFCSLRTTSGPSTTVLADLTGDDICSVSMSWNIEHETSGLGVDVEKRDDSPAGGVQFQNET